MSLALHHFLFERYTPMHLVRLTITLKGKLQGTTIELHGRMFKDGVFTTIATEAEATGLATYYGRSFNSTVTCTKATVEGTDEDDVLEDVLEEVLPNAGAEDDVVEDEVPEPDEDAEVVEEVSSDDEDEDEEVEYEVPSDREALLMTAISAIDQDEWVDDVVNHPAVSAIVEAVGDVTVTKEEIVAVIENWLEDDNTAEEEAAE